MLANKIKGFLVEIEEVLKETSENNKMPGNTFFLKNGNILCCERKHGESRFPYANDGYLLWAHSTGHIHAKNGLFNVFKPVYDNIEPAVEFFVGVENGDGTFFPISILGGAKQLFEPFQVKRYLIYSISAAYYIADTDFATFAVRVSMSKRKELIFTFECINKTQKNLNICLTSYFNPLLKKGEYDNMWTVGERRSTYKGEGTFVLSREACIAVLEEYVALIINRKISGAILEVSDFTTSRESFCGSLRRDISNAECLKTGRFCAEAAETNNIAAEILKLSIRDAARVDFVLPLAEDKNVVNSLLHQDIDIDGLDKEIEDFTEAERKRFNNMNITFKDFSEDRTKEEVFNHFLKTVQKQVDNCAMGKYYVEDLMGVRDIFQQLEQAMLWDKEQAREKMLRALGFLDPSGRSPRQFSIPDGDEVPKMDLREFVDQGNWIISCFYSYLSWTKDYSILDEIIGYYEIIEDKTVKKSNLKDSVLSHLIKITDYLDHNIDREEGTNCLRILYGDWNDALDGLGRTNDAGKKFGTGVSVMASLHFYQNLHEMAEILKSVGGYEAKITHYLKVREELGKGLIKHAVECNEKGEKRLIHGWGDHFTYKIGSFKDSDGLSRISFAPNAFWVSSGFIQETPELKDLILNTLHSLESRFGLKTLTPAFVNTPGVGRIAGMLPGTAENDCVYVHAALFSVIALFGLGDAKFAWKQLQKVLPISNEQMTKTPFVMSNSYLDNPLLGLNGQSSIDWYTGSGTVLIKNIVRYVVGLNPDLHGVVIQTARSMPCKKVNAEFDVKGHKIRFEYKNEGIGCRRYYLDGALLESCFDQLMQVEKAYVPDELLHENTLITVFD